MIQFSNEPNNPATEEPYGDYLARWLTVRGLLKTRYRDCLCLNPGYMPHMDEAAWVDLLADNVDVLALHVKWEWSNWNNPLWGESYKAYHDWYPQLPIVITEWGQTNWSPDRTQNCVNWLKEAMTHDYLKLACYYGVGLVGWDTENASQELLQGLAAKGAQMSTEVENWLAAYKQNHNGMEPADWEYMMHQVAIGELPAHPIDMGMVLNAAKSHLDQAILLAAKLIPNP